jgi:hypothetical protein
MIEIMHIGFDTVNKVARNRFTDDAVDNDLRSEQQNQQHRMERR